MPLPAHRPCSSKKQTSSLYFAHYVFVHQRLMILKKQQRGRKNTMLPNCSTAQYSTRCTIPQQLRQDEAYIYVSVSLSPTHLGCPRRGAVAAYRKRARVEEGAPPAPALPYRPPQIAAGLGRTGHTPRARTRFAWQIRGSTAIKHRNVRERGRGDGAYSCFARLGRTTGRWPHATAGGRRSTLLAQSLRALPTNALPEKI